MSEEKFGKIEEEFEFLSVEDVPKHQSLQCESIEKEFEFLSVEEILQFDRVEKELSLLKIQNAPNDSNVCSSHVKDESGPSETAPGPAQSVKKRKAEPEPVNSQSGVKQNVERPSPMQLFENYLRDNARECFHYCGLEFPHILVLLDFLGPGAHSLTCWQPNGEHSPITTLQQFLLVLVRLRSGYLVQEIVDHFHIPASQVTILSMSWIRFLNLEFSSFRKDMFSTKSQVAAMKLPRDYKVLPNIRVLVECTDLFHGSRSEFEKQENLDTQNKETFKVLLGCTPNGAISFISKVYEGPISNRDLFEVSKIGDFLEKGDLILADRGFDHDGVVKARGARLYVPRNTLCRDTEGIERERRECVERVIQRLKNFKVLTTVLPLDLRGMVDQIVFVCACLTNYQSLQFGTIEIEFGRLTRKCTLQGIETTLGSLTIEKVPNNTSTDSSQFKSQSGPSKTPPESVKSVKKRKTEPSDTRSLDLNYNQNVSVAAELDFEQQSSIQMFENYIRRDSKECLYYCGMEFNQIVTLLDFLGPGANFLNNWRSRAKYSTGKKIKFTILQEFLFVLVRLRRGYTVDELVDRFHISPNQVTILSMAWIRFMNLEFSNLKKKMFFKSKQVAANLPVEFKQLKNLRVLLESTSMFFETTPSEFEDQENVHSQQKDTFNALIGFTPKGAVSFVSRVFEGPISNRELFSFSGIEDFLEKDDLIVADRGFAYADLAKDSGARVYVPGAIISQCTNEIENERRNCVERAIRRIKNFCVLTTAFPHDLRGMLDQIVFVCACLTNYQSLHVGTMEIEFGRLSRKCNLQGIETKLGSLTIEKVSKNTSVGSPHFNSRSRPSKTLPESVQSVKKRKAAPSDTPSLDLNYNQNVSVGSELNFKQQPSIQMFENFIRSDSKECLYYCGMEFKQILTLLDFLGPGANLLNNWRSHGKNSAERKIKFTILQEFLLVLVRLRRGYSVDELVDRYHISANQVTILSIAWIRFMNLEFSSLKKDMFYKRKQVAANLPVEFKQLKDLRVLLESTRMFFESTPLEFEDQENVPSQQKDTFKALIGFIPGGAVSFVSRVFEGSISNRELFSFSGIEDFLEKDDLIVADRGFAYADLAKTSGARVYVPGAITFEYTDGIERQRRNCVGRAIRRIKKFRVLTTAVPHDLRGMLDQIVFVCACLSNYQLPLLVLR